MSKLSVDAEIWLPPPPPAPGLLPRAGGQKLNFFITIQTEQIQLAPEQSSQDSSHQAVKEVSLNKDYPFWFNNS